MNHYVSINTLFYCQVFTTTTSALSSSSSWHTATDLVKSEFVEFQPRTSVSTLSKISSLTKSNVSDRGITVTPTSNFSGQEKVIHISDISMHQNFSNSSNTAGSYTDLTNASVTSSVTDVSDISKSIFTSINIPKQPMSSSNNPIVFTSNANILPLTVPQNLATQSGNNFSFFNIIENTRNSNNVISTKPSAISKTESKMSNTQPSSKRVTATQNTKPTHRQTLYVCSVPGCKSTSKICSLFALPPNPVLAEKWLSSLHQTHLARLLHSNGVIPSNFLVCEKHFEKRFFIQEKLGKKLKLSAIPSRKILKVFKSVGVKKKSLVKKRPFSGPKSSKS